MGIRDVLGKFAGFVTGVVPSVLKLGEALNMLLAFITVKVASRDMPALREAAFIGIELGDLFADLGREVKEFFVLLLEASEDQRLDGNEIKALADEADDVVPVGAEIGVKAAALTVKIKSLF